MSIFLNFCLPITAWLILGEFTAYRLGSEQRPIDGFNLGHVLVVVLVHELPLQFVKLIFKLCEFVFIKSVYFGHFSEK